MLQPLAKIMRQNVVTLAKAFAEAKGLKLSTVSRMFHGDPQYLGNLVKGSYPKVDKYDASMEFFMAHWPEGVERPIIVQIIVGESVPLPHAAAKRKRFAPR